MWVCSARARCFGVSVALEDGDERDERDGLDADAAGRAHDSPERDAVLGKEASFGTFTVTMMWQSTMPDLTDLMGGCVVVVTIARKGDTHGGA